MHNVEVIESVMTSAEVSALMEVDRSTVTRWVKAGKLTPIRKGNGLRGERLFDRQSVEQFASERSQASA